MTAPTSPGAPASAERAASGVFAGLLVPHDELLPDSDPEQYGVNENEPFFDFVKPSA